MPTVSEYRNRAKHNVDLAEHIKDSGYLDWEITAIFYACLHRVKATLSFAGYTFTGDENHADIYDLVTTILGRVTGYKYKDLLSLSHTARYKPDIPVIEDDRNSARDYYTQIARACDQKDILVAQARAHSSST